MRTRAPLPWDVVVELIPGGPEELAAVVTRDVRTGVDLPGVAGLRLTIGRLGARNVLVGVEPLAEAADLPLEVALLALGRPVPVLARGTALQRRVLAVLADVPSGTVVTYGELAARAGSPGAARAAARVMATNRVPLVLPCHRVVPAGHGIGAYGWGADVKAALLTLEGAVAVTGGGSG